MGLHDGRGRIAGKQDLAGQHFKDQTGEGILVGGAADRPAFPPLGGDVGRGPDDPPG